MESFPQVVGGVLRRARKERGLTLHDVAARSRGRFKPSALGGYERGERMISLKRFVDLAGTYGVPADRLVAEVLGRLSPESRREVVIDLNRLARIRDDAGRLVAEFVHQVRTQRGDYLTDVITLRSGDLETLATASRLKPQALLDRLSPALRKPSRPLTRP